MITPRQLQDSAAVADHYDELDPIYRQLWGEHVHHGLWRTGREDSGHAVEALSDLVADKLRFSAGDHLVDIGCGYGATARRFATRGARVTGFTLSTEQLTYAPPTQNVTLIRQDWLENGMETGSARGAYSIESSEHMTDKPAFFRQARRVLEMDRRLVVCAWLASETPKAWEVRHLLEPICYEGRLPSMGSESEYRAMALASGFVCEDFEDLSTSVPRTWSICLGRLLRGLVRDEALRRQVLRSRNRLFALSVPRLMLAYRTGAMRYGIFTFVAR
ncbi:SAM-dependent methyltransferase [Sphingobium sp. SCG-1]|uniref:SAM-dependent methyltransferase n=1 Tax=Sphingobium sp. SCG-1 TaxID=2072936 RepID=UPI000CD67B33|nr:class I SAM-dependent methyltransferase [Sphingobium sp. SCG-1]AUW60027.1 SAM-dependent methyltransferase [Sphingobium sp. SCG-1]